MRTRRTTVYGAAALAALAFAASAVTAREDSGSGLRAVRHATAPFRHLATAVAGGYGMLRDAAGIACIDSRAGGMGVHYVNGGLVGDDAVNALTPEALVYEPQANGRMRLVAVEYVVFQAKWDATHSAPPSLYGHTFEAVGATNRYGIPPFYELHAWIWKHNPAGMFADWNPRVTCAHA